MSIKILQDTLSTDAVISSVEKSSNLILDKLVNWTETIIKMLPNMLLALLVFFLFILLAKGLTKLLKGIFVKRNINQELFRIFNKILYITVLSIGVMFCLSILNLDKTVTSLLAGAGIVGLALGFAFQDIAANFISGFFMASKKPFNIGDVIEVENVKGVVKKINLRTTELLDFDGDYVIIPNKQVFQSAIVNYSTMGKRRIVISVGVGYESDLEQVENCAKKTINSLEDTIQDKGVSVHFLEFGDSSINLDIKFWVEYPNNGTYMNSLSKGVKAIKSAFNKEGINIPFPIRTLMAENFKINSDIEKIKKS